MTSSCQVGDLRGLCPLLKVRCGLSVKAEQAVHFWWMHNFGVVPHHTEIRSDERPNDKAALESDSNGYQRATLNA